MAYQYAKGYPKGEFLLPSVTKIIGDCTDKSRALTQWSANQVVAWIQLNCAKSRGNFPHYKVNDEQLNQARFNFRDVSDTALEVGSAVHKLAEEHLLEIIHGRLEPEPKIPLFFFPEIERPVSFSFPEI